eukprot:TRINITY_DN1383_c0_g1_i1.p1 TRINITY_DN1383_c0_g1~~TRINITY_DN1383_c0_g1_i1.p1  ORF type:complete len:172 (-),score=41.58 TRINITY_DN1383_c0_g1_i1:55-570(-)
MAGQVVYINSPTSENSKTVMTPIVRKSGASALTGKKLLATLGVACLVVVGIAVPAILSHKSASASSSSVSSSNAASANNGSVCTLSGDFFEVTVSDSVGCAERRDIAEVVHVESGKAYFLESVADTTSSGGFWVDLYSSYNQSSMTCADQQSEVWCAITNARAEAVEYEGN